MPHTRGEGAIMPCTSPSAESGKIPLCAPGIKEVEVFCVKEEAGSVGAAACDCKSVFFLRAVNRPAVR